MRLRQYGDVDPSKDQRNAFDCGYDSLNRWLATQARQSWETRDAITYLLMDDDVIAGYFCISACSVGRDAAPPALAKRAPSDVPMIRMGRLAVDSRYKGQGWGAELLREALGGAAALRAKIGARGLLVDAIDEQAKSFYLKYGFEVSPIAPMLLMLGLSGIAERPLT